MLNLFKRHKILTFRELVFTEDSISKSAREALDKIENQEELRKYLESLLNQYSARIKFNNGYFISVKLGTMFHSNGVDTYEVYSNLDRMSLDYLTSEEVTEYMIKIQNQ